MNGLTRRDFLAGAATAAGALAVGGRAAAAPGTFDGTLRVLGLGFGGDAYDLPDPILKQAQSDLGFKIASTAKFPAEIERRVRQEPATFDIFSCFAQDMAEFWATGNLQPVQIARLHRWKGVTPLYKVGKALPAARCTYGQGDAAFRRLYVDPDRSGRWRSAPGVPSGVAKLFVQWVDESTGKRVGPEPKFLSGSPSSYNFDSFGYNAKVLGKRPDQLSWAELLNARWRHRVGLNGFETQGSLQDTANAVQAAGLMRFRDLGDPTRREIDRLVRILLTYKKRGQFFNIWPQGGDPVEWMQAGDVVLSAMYAPQIAALLALGVPVHQAAPREGYRAFAGLITISREVKDPATLDACYRYLNWWHSGAPGAVMLRSGYYNAVQATCRQFMRPGEYAYWVQGKPAAETYRNPYGDDSVAAGQVRDGGSVATRACRISSWNSTPRQQQYFLERWNEFISTF